jgi:hypothetical protein
MRERAAGHAGERERELGRRLSELARWAREAGFESVVLRPVLRYGGDDPAGAELRIAIDDRGAQVLVAATGRSSLAW